MNFWSLQCKWSPNALGRDLPLWWPVTRTRPLPTRYDVNGQVVVSVVAGLCYLTLE
jgi:hypothetical protein